MRFSRITTLVVAFLAMVASQSADATTLRIAHSSPDRSLINEAMTRFKTELETRTNGDITVEVYPNGLLGDEGPVAESVGDGSIDMGLGGVVDAIDPRLNVVSLPFLYSSFGDVHRLLDGDVGRQLYAMAEPHGYKILGVLDSGFRNFTNNKHPIEKPEDMQGMKFRVPPINVALETIKVFGGLPQTVPYGETYMALQSGAVDGAEPELRDFYDAKWYEVQKYLSLSNYMWMANYWFMNLDRFKSLPEDQQKAVTDVANNVQAWYRQEIEKVYKETLDKLTAGGVKVNDVDPAPFVAMVGPVYDRFSKDYGADLVNAVRAAASGKN